MKSLLSLIFLTVSIGILSAQTISESVEHLRRKYKNNQSISFDFIREFELGSSDTTYYFSVDVYNVNLELESVSLGLTQINMFANSGLGGESRRSKEMSYNIIRSEAHVEMGYTEFIEFFGCSNEMFVFMKTKKKFAANKPNTSAMCSKNGLTLGAEYYDVGRDMDKLKFYLSVGDTLFDISEHRFDEIASYLLSVRNTWGKLDANIDKS